VLICIRHQIPALQHRSISIPSSALYNGTRIRPTRWRAHLWLPRLEHHVERCICINHRRTTERTGDGAEMWTIDEAELAILEEIEQRMQSPAELIFTEMGFLASFLREWWKKIWWLYYLVGLELSLLLGKQGDGSWRDLVWLRGWCIPWSYASIVSSKDLALLNVIDLEAVTRDTQMRYAQVREDPEVQGLTSRAFLEVVRSNCWNGDQCFWAQQHPNSIDKSSKDLNRNEWPPWLVTIMRTWSPDQKLPEFTREPVMFVIIRIVWTPAPHNSKGREPSNRSSFRPVHSLTGKENPVSLVTLHSGGIFTWYT